MSLSQALFPPLTERGILAPVDAYRSRTAEVPSRSSEAGHSSSRGCGAPSDPFAGYRGRHRLSYGLDKSVRNNIGLEQLRGLSGLVIRDQPMG